MAVKIGINGFGRIGRNVLRTALADKNLDFVAVNDLTDPKTLAHLLKYDSILGNLPHKITAAADSISIDGRVIKVFKEKDPAALPWDSVGAQVVVGQPDLVDPQGGRHPDEVRDFLEREQFPPVQEDHFLGHAVGATQVAAVRDADPQIIVDAPESIGQVGGHGLGW